MISTSDCEGVQLKMGGQLVMGGQSEKKEAVPVFAISMFRISSWCE